MLEVSAHMDDFKATGEAAEVDQLQALLAKHFGDDVKMENNSRG